MVLAQLLGTGLVVTVGFGLAAIVSGTVSSTFSTDKVTSPVTHRAVMAAVPEAALSTTTGKTSKRVVRVEGSALLTMNWLFSTLTAGQAISTGASGRRYWRDCTASASWRSVRNAVSARRRFDRSRTARWPRRVHSIEDHPAAGVEVERHTGGGVRSGAELLHGVWPDCGEVPRWYQFPTPVRETRNPATFGVDRSVIVAGEHLAPGSGRPGWCLPRRLLT